MRDIAHDLNLSPGNLTYHFSKKEDVIIGIAERLSEQNSRHIWLLTSRRASLSSWPWLRKSSTTTISFAVFC